MRACTSASRSLRRATSATAAPFARQHLGEAHAQPARRAGDQRDPPLESRIVRPHCPCLSRRCSRHSGVRSVRPLRLRTCPLSTSNPAGKILDDPLRRNDAITLRRFPTLRRFSWPDMTTTTTITPRPRPRARLGAVRDAAARARAGDGADREGLHRPGRARRHHRGLRDQDRPAQRRRRDRQGLDRSCVQEGAARRRHQGGRFAGPRKPRRRPSGRGREHAAAPQYDRVHAVLLLSVGSARPAAGLVQVRALPLARGEGPARRARRFRRDAAEGHRSPRVGLDRRDALHRAADAARPAPRAGARRRSPSW